MIPLSTYNVLLALDVGGTIIAALIFAFGKRSGSLAVAAFIAALLMMLSVVLAVASFSITIFPTVVNGTVTAYTFASLGYLSWMYVGLLIFQVIIIISAALYAIGS